MIREWIQEYFPKDNEQVEAALREIMQEIALAGLQRKGFFEGAAFYGGTALRIFHGLDRYSEDLDFSLLEINPDFSLEPYLEGLMDEFAGLGMKISIRVKKKAFDSNIESAFLTLDTSWKDLFAQKTLQQIVLPKAPSIKIKIEVDRDPPLGFETEEKLLLRPISFYVKCFNLPCLFASRIHALLYRNWKQRVKGRDWYDLEWYVKRGVELDLHHFLLRAKGSGHGESTNISPKQIKGLLKERIDIVSFDRTREDVARFIPNQSALDIWSPTYFKDLVDKINFR